MPATLRLRAALFDLDGTLVDNMRHHARAWGEVFRRLGVDVPAERFERELAGRKNEEIFALLLGRPVDAAEVARWAGEKEVRYRELFAPDLRPVRGARELLSRLTARGLRLGLATAAPAENRAFVLDGLGLRGAFDRIVGAEDVARGKPAPDMFLAAAAALGVEPAACVVFEDAVNGVVAARAAGMLAVGLTTASDAATLRAAGAHFTAPDLAALPAELAALLGDEAAP